MVFWTDRDEGSFRRRCMSLSPALEAMSSARHNPPAERCRSAHVAKEGLKWPEDQAILDALVADMPSRPSDVPGIAKLGHRLYTWTKRDPTKFDVQHGTTVEAKQVQDAGSSDARSASRRNSDLFNKKYIKSKSNVNQK